MTDQDSDSLPYEKAAPNDYRWTSEAYEALIKGLMEASLTRQSDILTARVTGPCPRCRHEVNVSQVLDAVTGERSEAIDKFLDSAGVGAAETEYVTVPAACQCGEPHEGRPEGKTTGCGINFLVDIEMPQ
jgi:hypothetical protein